MSGCLFLLEGLIGLSLKVPNLFVQQLRSFFVIGFVAVEGMVDGYEKFPRQNR
jgi:hypothetical protein